MKNCKQYFFSSFLRVVLYFCPGMYSNFSLSSNVAFPLEKEISQKNDRKKFSSDIFFNLRLDIILYAYRNILSIMFCY